MRDIAIDRRDDRLEIRLGETMLAAYVFAPDEPPLESPRPYFDDLRTPAGRLVSESRPEDHPWHRALSVALPVVSGENFWGGPTFVRDRGYVQLENNGVQKHLGFQPGSAAGPVVEDLEWVTRSGATVIEERRALRAAEIDDRAWVLAFDFALRNVSGRTLAFGSPTTEGRDNAGYGGLFWRGSADLRGGLVVSADGLGGDELRGGRSTWLGFTGAAGDGEDGATVVIVGDPDNVRAPQEWFARSEEYACLCPAPFFSTEFELAMSDVLRLRYAVVVADGESDPPRASRPPAPPSWPSTPLLRRTDHGCPESRDRRHRRDRQFAR